MGVRTTVSTRRSGDDARSSVDLTKRRGVVPLGMLEEHGSSGLEREGRWIGGMGRRWWRSGQAAGCGTRARSSTVHVLPTGAEARRPRAEWQSRGLAARADGGGVLAEQLGVELAPVARLFTFCPRAQKYACLGQQFMIG